MSPLRLRCLSIPLLLTASVVAQTSEIPAALQPPAGHKLLFTAHAEGAQVYTCREAGIEKANWALKAPDAELMDESGKKLGRHFAGPTWEAIDGSSVVGKMTTTAASPDPDAIPWLLLTAVSHGPTQGRMTNVGAIQRIHTKGGKAPQEGCDSAHAGTELRVAYSADYNFYSGSIAGR